MVEWKSRGCSENHSASPNVTQHTRSWLQPLTCTDNFWPLPKGFALLCQLLGEVLESKHLTTLAVKEELRHSGPGSHAPPSLWEATPDKYIQGQLARGFSTRASKIPILLVESPSHDQYRVKVDGSGWLTLHNCQFLHAYNYTWITFFPCCLKKVVFVVNSRIHIMKKELCPVRRKNLCGLWGGGKNPFFQGSRTCKTHSVPCNVTEDSSPPSKAAVELSSQ